jgi:glycosyltransferase involved in cell wall biosynthesis
MKKILIIGMTNRIGGVETFIYNTTSKLQGEEISFDFLVHGSKNIVFEEEIKKYQNCNIYYFNSIKRRPISVSFKLWKFYLKNRNKYDYIHFQSGMCSEIMYVFPFCLFTKAKLISHSHNGNGKKIMNCLFRPIVNLCSYKKIACSPEAANWLFGTNKNVFILKNGVDTNKFKYNEICREKIRNQIPISDNTFLIGHIGRFSEQKNHTFILSLADKLKNKNINFKIILIGEGEKYNEIYNEAKMNNLLDVLIFAGKKNNTNEFYSAFDMFILPSLYEGLPIVGVEAQTNGLYCLFSDRISNQVVLTDRSKMIPLELNEWEKEISVRSDNNIDSKRKLYAAVIDDKEFSLEATCKNLKKIYMEEK